MLTVRIGSVLLLCLASFPVRAQDTESSGEPFIKHPVVAAQSRPRMGTDQQADVKDNSPKSEALGLAAPQARPAARPVPVVITQEGTTRHVRTVCRLSSAPAVDAAATINQLLAAEGQAAPGNPAASVVIVPDAVSNSLVIGGPQEAVEQVRELLERIDCPAVMVRVEVVLADVPGEQTAVRVESRQGEATGRSNNAPERLDLGVLPKNAKILCRAQLTTLANQAAFLQVGKRQPVVSGVSVSPRGQTNSVSYENIGTRIAITPRVDPNGPVTLVVDVEDSRLGPSEQPAVPFAPAASSGSEKVPVGTLGSPVGAAVAESQSPAVRSPHTETMTTQSTVRVPDGQTMVLAGMSRQPDGKQRLILLTPRVLRLDGRK